MPAFDARSVELFLLMMHLRKLGLELFKNLGEFLTQLLELDLGLLPNELSDL